ncbi:HDIG domain-containing protein [bacterium]|nr:HDIG domain-containing protein [bacterium]
MDKIKIPEPLKEFLLSAKFLNSLYFFLFTLVMTLIIASQNFLFQRVVENGISRRDIIAEKTIVVEDTKRTEQHKKEVAQKIEPIMTVTEDDFIKNNLSSLQSSILKIREKDTSEDTKREELSLLFDSDNITKQNFVINYLLKTPENDLKTLFEKSKLTLINILNIGISERDFDKHFLNNIISKHVSADIPKNQVTVIKALLEQILVPNLVVDEFATDIARKNAQNAVKPYEVTFEKGDKILFEGEPVTKLKRDALRQAGYNLVEVNFNGLAGVFFVIAFSVLAFLMYLNTFEKNKVTLSQIQIMAILSVVLAFIAVVLPTGFSPYVLPFPAYIMLISIVLNPRIAFVSASLMLGIITMGMQYDIQFMSSLMIVNVVSSVFMAKVNFTRRFDLIKAGIYIATIGAFFVVSIYLLEKFMIEIENILIIRDAVLMFINGVISSMIVLGVLPLLESAFKIVTPYALAELADHNQPVLKRLQMEAPGTYHHCLMVANLCEAAAEAIGANPILAKVGAYYHDIGKLKRPFFFVENQSSFGIENPHNKLNSRLSKMVVTAHTKDGVEIAKEYHLPPIINDFILQHHGDGLASYFYNQAIKEEGAENVKEEQFRYSGPKPKTKEAAILMIADAVEAAVRAMKATTAEEIDPIIKKIVDERLKDNQLSECPLTFSDINIISATFSRILRGTQHDRIKYHQNIVEELDSSDVILPSQMHIMDKEMEEKVKKLENGNND